MGLLTAVSNGVIESSLDRQRLKQKSILWYRIGFQVSSLDTHQNLSSDYISLKVCTPPITFGAENDVVAGSDRPLIIPWLKKKRNIGRYSTLCSGKCIVDS